MMNNYLFSSKSRLFADFGQFCRQRVRLMPDRLHSLCVETSSDFWLRHRCQCSLAEEVVLYPLISPQQYTLRWPRNSSITSVSMATGGCKYLQVGVWMCWLSVFKEKCGEETPLFLVYIYYKERPSSRAFALCKRGVQYFHQRLLLLQGAPTQW